MNTFENYLTSGFEFSDDEYELKSKYIFMNSMFAAVLIVVTVLMVLLILKENYVFAGANAIFLVLNFFFIYLLRKSRTLYSVIIPVILLSSIVLVTIALSLNPAEHVRVAWFLVIIVLAFFLGGKPLGSAATFLSLFSIYSVSFFGSEPMDGYTLFLSSVIITLGALFIYQYEKRSTKARKILLRINRDLEKRIKDETKKRTIKLNEQKAIFEHLAHYDPLTELPNRTLLNDRLKHALARAKRLNTKLALLFLDLDFFKEINDSLGHHIGDRVLKVVAQRLQNELRVSDTIARLGGDEFTVLLEDIHDGAQVVEVAGKLLNSLKESICIDEHEVFLSISIGISTYPDDGDSAQILLQNADAAMYGAKHEGRNAYRFYAKEMTEHALKRVTLETEMRHAMRNGEFILYYQPQVDTRTGTLTGMEALIRWYHPEEGLKMPGEFIPLAETTQIIIPLGEWVLRTACVQAKAWRDNGINPGRISVNLSVNQLRHNSVVYMIKECLEETGCKAEWIELEITESFMMQNPDQSSTLLKQIRNLGITLSIDDFGTGYSSLAYLKRLSIDKLKIDRSFIVDLPEGKEDETIVETIISIAESLGLEVIAEGVETEAQKNFLQKAGCHLAQGYLYAKPMPAEIIEKEFLNH